MTAPADGASPVTEFRTVCGESPMWVPAEQCLYWTDWAERKVFRHHPASGASSHWRLDARPGCLVARRGGGLAVACANGFHLFDPSDGALTFVLDPDPDQADTELNDGKCDRRGRFWAGSMHSPATEPKGALFRLDADFRCRRSGPPLVLANGIAFSPDDRTMYVGDSGTRRIMACGYDIESGALSSPRPFARVAAPAAPDGSTVDEEGFLWSAQYDGWRLVRYDPEGRVDRVIDLPVRQPTSCIFGGESLDILYVTTARFEQSERELESQPLAGALLALDVGVGGLPEPAFAG